MGVLYHSCKGGINMNFDEKEVTQLIMEETGESLDMAERIAELLQLVHPDLFPVIEAWIKGEKTGYELYNGITLDEIIELERDTYKPTYIQAVLVMNQLLNDPEQAKYYRQFTRFKCGFTPK